MGEMEDAFASGELVDHSNDPPQSPEGAEGEEGQMSPEEMAIAEAAMRNKQQQQEKQQALQQLKGTLETVKAEEEEFWKVFDEHREGAYYDAVVDEIQATPTYRLSTLGTITELMHQGIQIPQEILIRYLDIEESIKEEWQSTLGGQQQQAQQMQQSQMQFQMELEKLKGEMQLMKQKLANEGNLQVAEVKASVSAGGE